MTDNVKYRIKFEKRSRIKFIGHLDLLKVFQLSVNRAGLPIAYSNGFNPHQQMSFAQPLSLGFESVGEYIDIELSENINTEEIKDKLNTAFPEGLLVTGVRPFKQSEKAGASLITYASYEVTFPENIKIDGDTISAFLNREHIIIVKKGKKKSTEVDIRPDIYQLEATEEDGKTVVKMIISTGSLKNLKAEAVIAELCQFTQNEYIPYKFKYKRTEMFKCGENELESLLD